MNIAIPKYIIKKAVQLNNQGKKENPDKEKQEKLKSGYAIDEAHITTLLESIFVKENISK